ncbi:hypothetical protein AWM79_13085 [Pseudomonas agarici]|uniref:diguanylate cyclase n=2 Tax=Pseudomonas agarici TaxID=46677 RepID=A0A0X1T2A1_PSEAA|nr:GGDEF domain-containing protein [Pseudomonas agarici]AMB86182.1 hypothetical protein AWM79_13085 [Pseudomonas agarici]NWB90164.1 diguanylate cyclase [Pseudomonas agarici]
MSSEEALRWKEKYLKSIEQQEKLERRWEARLDLLRRGLVRSTLAAEGSDRAVDQCMKEMREVVRTDDMDGPLAALLPRLEKAVLDSEQRRETRVEQIGVALLALVTQLQSLPLPREVSRPLKNFAKQLDGRVGQAREIPLLLSELSGLQGKALTQLEQPVGPERPGLLQRLFGSKETAEPTTDTASAQAPVAAPAAATSVVARASIEAAAIDSTPPAPGVSAVEPEPGSESEAALPAPPVEVVAYKPPAGLSEPAAVPLSVPAPDAPLVVAATPVIEAACVAWVPVEPVEPLDQPEAITPVPPPVLAPLDSEPLPSVMAETPAAVDPEPEVSYALPESPEPSYSSVAEHIASTLLGLLGDLTLPERHRPHAEAMRHRLDHGLNWYELLPILDDLAVLMLAINNSGQHEFETYLRQLNERLESFQSHLQVTREDHAEGCSQADKLHNRLREHVGGLQSGVQDAVDLESLKQVLENRLEGLLGTLDQHQQQRDLREQDAAARLQSLAERVAHMEQEAQGYRDHLEEQRHKALIDPLTGLANRAAWSERLDHEVGQWQQHGNNLLIAMLDLDHFKRINDNYGHLAGDKVLKIIASVLRERLRPGDFIARFGGEEFVLLMPETPLAVALKLIESMRAAIEASPFHFKGERVTITASIGVSAFQAGERSDHVLKRADEALYRAKGAGRNRVELS